jgi:acetoacetyl-CoA synthetase
MTPAHENPLWEPTSEFLARSTLGRYLGVLQRERGLTFDGYQDLWEWSRSDLEGFWSSVWEFFDLGAASSYGEVLADEEMPGARWFTGARVNFAERCLAGSGAEAERVAIIGLCEDRSQQEITYGSLREQVAAVAATWRRLGVQPGDCVAGYLPNLPEAVVALLATAVVGAVWTSVSPDFGVQAVLARLSQAGPIVLVGADAYCYGGREHLRQNELAELAAGLPTLRALVTVRHGRAADAPRPEQPAPRPAAIKACSWDDVAHSNAPLEFADVAFDDPLWILWSSGTTGTPKGIVQGHGGITVELLKALALGCDIQPSDRFFFLTSTSWMVWNFLVGGLLVGASIVCYDGSPTYPDLDGAWRVAERTGASVVGVGAAYLLAGAKAAREPRAVYDLSALRSILQTGSTLPAEAWHWTCENVRPGVWLQSICGGTDVCSALIAASPLLPVYAGRIPGPSLGVALEAWDEAGRPVVGEPGELVVTRPMPSMPLRFVDDADGSRYFDAYFANYPGVWRHGDWVTVGDDLSVTVGGRSDATLNRMGVRMGSADIYAVLDEMPELADSMVLGIERDGGGYWMPLFVVPGEGVTLDDDLVARINTAISTKLSPRHVPDIVIEAPGIPRTPTGKRLEIPVKRILQGNLPPTTGVGAVDDLLTWFASMRARPSAPPGVTTPDWA